MPSIVIRRTQTMQDKIAEKQIYNRHIADNTIVGSAKLLGSSVGKHQAPFALMGSRNLQRILYGTGVFVLNSKGTVAVAIPMSTPFPTACDFVMPMFGDQSVGGIPVGCDVHAGAVVARWKGSFRWDIYVKSAVGTPANCYYSYLAIGR